MVNNLPHRFLSAAGLGQDSKIQLDNVRFGSKADIGPLPINVRAPIGACTKSDHICGEIVVGGLDYPRRRLARHPPSAIEEHDYHADAYGHAILVVPTRQHGERRRFRRFCRARHHELRVA
jgi:hypothetical protein